MSRPRLSIVVSAALLLAFLLGIAIYEQAAFGWHFAREEAPVFDLWHWLRTTIAALLSAALVVALARPGLRNEPLGRRAIALPWFIGALSLALEVLLAVSPSVFARIGVEDGPIEWLSALLLFAAAGFMAARARGIWRRPSPTPYRALHLVVAVGFVLLFVLMAGEEVSWFQRQIGFGTPETFAARNWQGEFNLHNFNTDVSELALYSSTGVFLMLLPLLRESEVARYPWVRPFAALLPDRTVAAVSAPMLVFTYSHWTLLPVQSAFWIGLAVCIAFAANSATRSGLWLWSALAAWVALGQALMLVNGQTMLMIFDSSEYRELFIDIGLAAYAFRQWRQGDA